MNTDVHSLIGAYVLDAVDPSERATFEAHLQQCEECLTELPGLIETSTRVGETAESTAPPELRDRLMMAITQTTQERPVVASLATHRNRIRSVVPRVLVAAATVVALAGIGAFAVQRDHNADLQAQQDKITSVITASDAQLEDAKAAGGGTVRVMTSESAGTAIVMPSDMPKLKDKAYQLWTITDGKARSEGLMKSDAPMQLVNNVKDSDAIAITIEPAGGSEQPTTPPIVSVPS